MASVAIALALVLDRPVSWSGSPVIVTSPGTAHVRTVFQKVDIDVTSATVTYKTKLLYKNTGDQPIEAQVMVPVLGAGGDDAWFVTKVTGSWGGKVVATSGMDRDTALEDNWSRWYSFPVKLAAGEWKPFESTLTRPLPKTGEGLAERFVTYLQQPVSDTLEQFQIAIHYPKGLLFHVVTSSPSEGWQIGERGAFWSKNDYRPGKTSFRLQFYPNTFEKIGR